MNNEMMDRLANVEKKYARMKTIMMSLGVILMISLISLSFVNNRSKEILRVRGIIVEDSRKMGVREFSLRE